MAAQGLSLVIISFNEVDNLSRCIGSVGDLADEVLVVDSFSTDGTQELARQLGATVIERSFEGHREQKQWAISQAQYDWVLSLDADEALDSDLRKSIKKVKANYHSDGYYMNRLNRLNGQWIRYGAWYPDRKMRLFHRDKYQMGGRNPHDRFDPQPGAKTENLTGDILHYTNDDLSSRVETQNKFSTLAAQSYYEAGKRGSLWRVWFKPKTRFLGEYLWKGGWRDGFHGYYIAKTSAQYVFWREAKLLDLCRKEQL
ncbi:MAG: glycosyltransferase family 2 protein [Bacteroidota bacterium]